MPRKRANKRKTSAPVRRELRLPKVNLPTISWGLISNTGLLLAVVAGVYFGTLWLLDQQIDSVRIEGRFERVSSLQVEAAITPYMNQGFLGADLRTLQRSITELPWVQQASVRRSWPSTLLVSITEERAAARWGKDGLLNIYGELFVEHASHIPAELPHLMGPPGTELEVAQRFFELDDQMKQRGLMAVSLAVDPRGSWELGLSNGMQVRFGAVALELRTARFFEALDQLLAPVADKVDYVDMRYTNGFAIGWKPGVKTRLAEQREIDPHA
jgi:cell division protein FtsQ